MFYLKDNSSSLSTLNPPPPPSQIMHPRLPNSVFPDLSLKISKYILELSVFKSIRIFVGSGAIKAIPCS